LHHPNIVQFLGVTIFPAALVTEFCARGSLTSVLQGANQSPERAAELTWKRRISLAADCVRGMLYLHTRTPPIIHRDLKSANLLVTSAWTCKVSDFNLSKIMEESTRSTSLQAMNPRWLAPQLLQGGIADLRSDVFAFGVVLWELLTFQLPWGASNPWGIVSAVTAGQRLSIPAANTLPGPEGGSWPKLGDYVALMERCWAQEPADRPNFEQVMAALRLIDPEATQSNIY
jgi:serine/threonine protein kinase